MTGIDRPTPGPRGGGPTSTRDSTGAQPTASGSPPQPSRRRSNPMTDPLGAGRASEQRRGASFSAAKRPAESDAEQARRLWNDLLSKTREGLLQMGFEPSQLDDIVNARGDGALQTLQALILVYNFFAPGGRSDIPEEEEGQKKLRSRLVDLAIAGGAEALRARQMEYMPQSECTPIAQESATLRERINRARNGL